MPELPEVHTIIKDLTSKVKGETIVGFWSDWKKAVKSGFSKLEKEIKGRKILGFERIGKNILMNLSGGKTVIIHLKMTGHLLVKPKGWKPKAAGDYLSEKVNQYIHHIFSLSSGKTIEFSDLRKFGRIILADSNQVGEVKEIKSLGIDPLSREFTFDKFDEILKKRKTKIRLLLMNQNLIAGIGNIYVSEILFDAGIMPARIAKSLNLSERKSLYKSIQKILKKAIKLRGTSDSDYRDTSGAPGKYQNFLLVYGKKGAKCPKCSETIKVEKIGQRSSYCCPKCQK